jgi:hypothetical protein
MTADDDTSFFGAGFNTTTTEAWGLCQFPVQMRIAPTALEQTGTAANYRVMYLATNSACNSVPTIAGGDTWAARVQFSVASGLTAGQGSMLRSAVTGAYLGFTAEL